MADCSSPLAPLITFAGGACVDGASGATSIGRVQTQYVNGPKIKTNGLDVEMDYTFFLNDLTLTVGTSLTHIFNYDVEEFVINGVTVVPAYDAIGFLNADREPQSLPRWKVNSFLNANIGGLNARYVFRYASGLKDDRYENPAFATTAYGPTTFGKDIDAYTQHDLTVLYDLPFKAADIQLQASVENIFNEDPPAARAVLGYDPFVGNPLGRVFRLGLKAGF